MNRLLLFNLLALILFTSGCLKDDCDATRTFYEAIPVYKFTNEFRTKLSSEPARELEDPGKIFVLDKYLFVNEIRKGIHIFDVSDVRNPQNLSFIPIEGNVDMAVVGHILYADNYSDLLTIDISDPLHPSILDRQKDVFSLFGYNENTGYLVYYEETQRKMEVNCNDPLFETQGFNRNGGVFFNADLATPNAGKSTILSALGIAGSFSRFGLSNHHLYTVDHSSMRIFDISEIEKPFFKSEFYAGWNIETIFPYNDNLFLGSSNGMFIYQLSDPTSPQRLAHFTHARACDPVFVQGNRAYITLRDGTTCESFSNQLDVVDISSLTNPRLVESFEMHNPHGLSVRDNRIIICEGDQGVKLFDIEEETKIDENLLDHEKGFYAYDVISVRENFVIVVGSDGIYNFDISDDKWEQLSHISIVKK